jgi:Spy/CpxP family protein refolding chaperone
MRLNWKRTSGIAAITAAVLLTLAVVGFSQGRQGPPRGGGFPGGPGGPGGPRDGLGPFGRDLNLTDAQKAQIKTISSNFEESTKSLRDQLRALHESEPDPLSGAFDEATVRSAAEARAKVEVEMAVARAKMMSQISAVLTGEQKAQLAAKRQQFGQRQPPPPPQL